MATPAQTQKRGPKPETSLAITKNETVNAVMRRVGELQGQGRLVFPPNYSPENALMSAYLILQGTTNREKKPVLEACTRDSIANSLLDMVVQGLNPAKRQCYFIAYGSQLVCQRSYFGTVAVTKRVTGARDIYAEVVYEDDDFGFEIVGANTRVVRHLRKLTNVDRRKIKAAYCTIVLPEPDREPYTQVMTIEQIHEAWKKSQNSPFDEQGRIKPGSVHGQFTEEMAKKTVTNRTCKLFVNSSDDSSLDLVVQRFNEADDRAEEAAFQEELRERANQEVIDAEIRDVADTQEPETAKTGPEEPGW